VKRILITGATGLIGSHLYRSLIASGNNVYGLGRQEHPPPELADINWIHCDLSKPIDSSVLPCDTEVIIHLAQSRRFREFPEGAKDMFTVNMQSTFDMLDYGKKVGIQQFIYASSGGIYGFGKRVFKETDDINIPSQLNFYLSLKYASELIIHNYSSIFSTAIIRPFFVYGPGQRRDMLIPRLICRVKEKQSISLNGKNGIIINPVYVGDTVAAIEHMMKLGLSETFNIGGSEILSLRQIGELIGKSVGEKPVFECHEETKPGYLAGDISKMSAVLGKPQISFTDGLEKTLQSKLESKK